MIVRSPSPCFFSFVRSNYICNYTICFNMHITKLARYSLFWPGLFLVLAYTHHPVFHFNPLSCHINMYVCIICPGSWTLYLLYILFGGRVHSVSLLKIKVFLAFSFWQFGRRLSHQLITCDHVGNIPFRCDVSWFTYILPSFISIISFGSTSFSPKRSSQAFLKLGTGHVPTFIVCN